MRQARHATTVSPPLPALASPVGFGQLTDPQAVVEAFLAPSGIRDKRAVYTADMLSYLNAKTLGQEVAKNATRHVRLLSSDSMEARFAIEITADGVTQDWYAFVRLDQGVWKLAAMRSMQIAGLPNDAQLRAGLQARLAEFDATAEAVRARQPGQICSLIWNGSVECVIAKALRNTAGYLYVPEGVQPPPMTPDEWMYVEHAAGRWYVFKRT